MAKSAITLAAPPADEAADALLSTKKLIKPKKSGSIKGILAAAAAVSFALGLAATTATLPTGWLISQEWSLTVEGGLGNNRTGADGPRSEGGKRIILDNSPVYVHFLPFVNGRVHLGRISAH